MEEPGSSLLEMEDFSAYIGMDVASSFEGPNSNMTVKFFDFLERPQVVENYSHLTKSYCQATEQLAAVGVNSREDRPTDVSTRNTNEDHCYVSMPTQEIDCSKLNGIDEALFYQECVGIPNARTHLNAAEKESTDSQEKLALNQAKNSVEPEFIPQKCDKKKNPHYLLEPGEIFCKPNIPVKIRVVGVEREQTVNVSLQYKDTMLENSPVVACGQHRLRGEDVLQHPPFQQPPQELLKYNYPPDFSFFSTEKSCDYKLINGNPTVVIQVQEDDIDQEESSMMFNLVFVCLNSCHKTRGKNLYLSTKLADSQGNVVKEQRFNIRVCKNVKRDHKEKRAIEENKDAPVSKKMKTDPEGGVAISDPCPTSIGDNSVEEKRFYWIHGEPSKLQMFRPLFDALDIKIEEWQFSRPNDDHE